MSIGVAIIGSGIFAREEHLPGVQATETLSLKAIYSRSLASATKLVSGVTPTPDLYSEDSGPGKSYDDLLARSDIAAVIIALPILAQPTFIRKALAAGKHVLSEKPIAKDLETAQTLLSWYNGTGRKTVWAVAENWRFMSKFQRTAAEVRKLGALKAFRVNMRSFVGVESKYYKTEWRQTPEYQGGFVLDGGVHMVAGLRLVLGDDSLAVLSAQSCLQQRHLAPVDTVDAVVRTRSGATGAVSLSYGSAISDSVFEFACENGVVTLNGDQVTVNGASYEVPFEGRGVNKEIAEFGASIVAGTGVSQRLRPEEALADLEVMERMFGSEGERRELQLQN